jgi:hypothetical protein
VPLSWFCASRAAALFFLLVVNPLASLAGALYLAATGAPASCFGDDDPAAAPGPLAATAAAAARATAARRGGGGPPRGAARVAALYRELLLRPSHWLASWRLNCVLVAWHARVGGSHRDYALEDKVGGGALWGGSLGRAI